MTSLFDYAFSEWSYVSFNFFFWYQSKTRTIINLKRIQNDLI